MKKMYRTNEEAAKAAIESFGKKHGVRCYSRQAPTYTFIVPVDLGGKVVPVWAYARNRDTFFQCYFAVRGDIDDVTLFKVADYINRKVESSPKDAAPFAICESIRDNLPIAFPGVKVLAAHTQREFVGQYRSADFERTVEAEPKKLDIDLFSAVGTQDSLTVTFTGEDARLFTVLSTLRGKSAEELIAERFASEKAALGRLTGEAAK